MRYPIIVIGTLALLAASSLLAQNTTTGQIRGAITDASAAGVPGANILAQDLATGLEKHATPARTYLYDPGPAIWKVQIDGH